MHKVGVVGDKDSILGDSGIRENIDFCIDKLKSINNMIL